MNKICVTGHKGFVGSYLTKALDEKNIEWVGFDLKDGLDIRQSYQVYEFFDFHRPDTVIHLAALAGVRRGEQYPQEYFDTNVLGTWNVVRVAEKFKVNKFINFSSSSIYGDRTSPVSEDDYKTPKSIYGKTKLAAEQIVRFASDIHYRTSIRPFTIYGLFGRKDMVIYKWLDQIKQKKPIDFYGDGNSKRGYVHVEDLVKGVLLYLKKDIYCKDNTFAYNLGGQEVISLKELFEIFNSTIKGIKVNWLGLPSSDIYENWANIDKAKKELGWKPIKSFRAEVIKIIKNYE